MTQLLDHGYCKLVESWGSDRAVIEAARMSTDKGFQGWGGDECDHLRLGGLGTPCCKGTPFCVSDHGDQKLLHYLYTHKHMTPFEMAGMVIEVQAPIMVFREWHRHRTQSYNEMSGRYTELPNLYYLPAKERMQKQTTTNKQGSAEVHEFAGDLREVIRQATEASRRSYENLLEHGISREVARLVLPVNQYSRMRASANLRNWLGFLTLRMDPAAQWEIRQYANAVATLIEQFFPRTYALFTEAT
jgi:thymidylate synthase (FAD)